MKTSENFDKLMNYISIPILIIGLILNFIVWYGTYSTTSSNYEIYKSLPFVDKKELKNIEIKDYNGKTIYYTLNSYLNSYGDVLGTYKNLEKGKGIITIRIYEGNKEQLSETFFHEYLHHLYYINKDKISENQKQEILKYIKDNKLDHIIPINKVYEDLDEDSIITETISYLFSNHYNKCREYGVITSIDGGNPDTDEFMNWELSLIKYGFLPENIICK